MKEEKGEREIREKERRNDGQITEDLDDWTKMKLLIVMKI